MVAGGEVVYDYFADEHDSDGAHPLAWRRMQLVADRPSASTVSEDAAICTFDIAKIDGSGTVGSWSSTDYTTCEGLFTTFLNSYKPNFGSGCHFNQYRWYDMRFAPYTVSKPFRDSGPPQRVTSISIAGGSSSSLPYQLAISVTEKTGSRRHWGRFYLPCPAQNTVDLPAPRITSAVQTSIATAAGVLYGGLMAANFLPVVPFTQVAGVPQRGLMGITSVQVDDIFDVQRSRRPATVAQRVVKP